MRGMLSTTNWIDALDRHYLAEYLPAGGSAIKFAACFAGVNRQELLARLQSRAAGQGLLVAAVDSATTKVHLIDQLFIRIADQMPWNTIVERLLAGFASANFWQVPPAFTDEGIVEQLARLNQFSSQQVSLELQRQIADKILINRRLAKDFRFALHWLARSRLTAGAEGDGIRQSMTDWLGGRIRAIRDLKRYEIFAKVNRANARHLLGSLLACIRQAGFSGLTVTLDAFRMLSSERAVDGSLNYTKAALLDGYEVFRQFIDSTDELEGLLLVGAVPPEFIDLDPHGRGLACYSALLFRVYDDVRDRNLANPLTALVRLSDSIEAAA